jgi:hypothetical protein
MAVYRGRSTNTLAMVFQPTRAASVFTLAFYSPAILVISVISAWPLVAQVVVAAGVVASWCLFLLGARVARRPHSAKSLIYALLVTWSLSYCFGSLAKRFVPNGGIALDAAMAVLSLVFIFLAGWRLAPRTAVEVHG